MTDHPRTRRGVLATFAGTIAVAAMPKSAQAALATPSATEGPYYPTPSMRRADVDNDLVKITGAVREAGGEVIHLTGRVMDATGAPRPGLRVEIWQCDTDGRYMHDRDPRSDGFDAAFQGFGHDISGEDGGYEFRTIKPVSYPGRTPHIHVKVFDGEDEILTTQFYIDGHPMNARDGLFRRMSAAEAKAVSMVFEESARGVETTVDIRI